MLRFGHVRLSCQHGGVDPEGLGHSRDEIEVRGLGTAFDLVEEAVRVRNTVGQLPLWNGGSSIWVYCFLTFGQVRPVAMSLSSMPQIGSAPTSISVIF